MDIIYKGFSRQPAVRFRHVSGRWLASLMLVFGVSAVALADAPGANREGPPPFNILIPRALVGSPSGSPQRLVCPDDAAYMVGVEGRFGNWIDALAPLCTAFDGSGRWDRRFALVGASAGGTGGHPESVVCAFGSSLVNFRADAYDFRHEPTFMPSPVVSVGFECTDPFHPRAEEWPQWLDTPYTDPWADCDQCLNVGPSGEESSCPTGTIARGIEVHATTYVQGIALLCGRPPVGPKALGRVERPEGVSNPNEGKSYCQLAESARARNSPTAPDLEARCEASKGPPKVLGRTYVTDINPAPAPEMTFCDRAKAARARNSPTAAALEARCAAEIAAQQATQ